jgi:hypothetical protein
MIRDVDINTADAIVHLAAAASLHAPHYLPLIRAVQAGRLLVAAPTRQGTVSLGRLRRSGRPAMVVIGDDDYGTTGPDGWACAERVLGWARQIIIHAAAGHPEDYAGIVAATQVVRRLVLIECASSAAMAWNQTAVAWGRQATLQTIIPPPGVQHPAPLVRSKMQ